MTMWTAILLACAAAYGLKVSGFLVPPSAMDGERRTRVSTLLPVALLTGLVVVQTLVSGTGLVLDARAAAVAVAVVLLLLRANFLVVVAGAALVAALLRLAGWLP